MKIATTVNVERISSIAASAGSAYEAAAQTPGHAGNDFGIKG